MSDRKRKLLIRSNMVPLRLIPALFLAKTLGNSKNCLPNKETNGSHRAPPSLIRY